MYNKTKISILLAFSLVAFASIVIPQVSDPPNETTTSYAVAAVPDFNQWSRRWGSEYADAGYDMTVSPNGDVIVTGVNSPSSGFGVATVTKYSGITGSQIWSKTFAIYIPSNRGAAVAADQAGNILVAVIHGGSLDSGGFVLLHKLSGNDGSVMWTVPVGAGWVRDLAVDHNQDVVVIGDFSGTVDFGGGQFTADGTDVFLAKYSGASGAHIWSKQFGGPGQDDGTGVAVDANGDILLVGAFQESISFGGQPLINPVSLISPDSFVAKLSSSGIQVWSRETLNGDSSYFVNSIALDSRGETYVSGGVWFTGMLTVHKLSGASGTEVWSRDFGQSISSVEPRAIAVNENDEPIIIGSFIGPLNLGGGMYIAEARDIFVLKLSAANGSYIWSTKFGGIADDNASSVATRGRRVFITGSFSSPSINFWSGQHTNAGSGSEDGFVAKVVLPKHVSHADFNNDGLTEAAVFRPSNGNWYVLDDSGAYSTINWGVSTDIPTPADFDRDGKADIAVFRPSTGQWFVLNSSDNSCLVTEWGVSTDRPVPADYDGDDKADIAVFRPSTGQWFILRSSDGSAEVVEWGASTDLPVQGNYDSDNKTDIAVYRPSTGQWFVVQSTGGGFAVPWGAADDKPVPGDYDADGKDDFAVFRPSDGNWYYIKSKANNAEYGVVNWGIDTDIPVPGDYDRDGIDDIAVFRPSTGDWYVLKSTTGLMIVNWGTVGDKPLPTSYIP